MPIYQVEQLAHQTRNVPPTQKSHRVYSVPPAASDVARHLPVTLRPQFSAVDQAAALVALAAWLTATGYVAAAPPVVSVVT